MPAASLDRPMPNLTSGVATLSATFARGPYRSVLNATGFASGEVVSVGDQDATEHEAGGEKAGSEPAE